MAGKINAGDVIVIDSSTGKIWINNDVVISERGGSEHADKVMGWAQSLTKSLARRTRYAPFTLLPVAWMTDKGFEAMIEDVMLKGEWLEGVVLDIEASLPFATGKDGLSALAKLSVPYSVQPIMAERLERINKVFMAGIKTHTLDNVPVADTPMTLLEMDNKIVRIDVDGWKAFMGPIYDLVIEQCKMALAKNFVVDFVGSEDDLVQEMFGG